MANLKTSYMGLELNNPIIVGSSGLARTVDGVRKAAQAGAGAIVLKSLFEEEVRLSFADTQAAFAGYPHPEAVAYLQADLATHFGTEGYLDFVAKAAAEVAIPVIASINCTSPAGWVAYAGKLARAGAAAIELNIYHLPLDASQSSDEIEQHYLATIAAVCQECTVPLAVKLAPDFTNLMRLALRVDALGVNGLVLFNRLFHPDIDVEREDYFGSLYLSQGEDYRQSLRWVSVLAGRTRADLCAATGIHDSATVVRQLLAGAEAVQVTSLLYRQGLGAIAELIAGVNDWMNARNHGCIEDFRGSLSRARASAGELVDRVQYIKSFVGLE